MNSLNWMNEGLLQPTNTAQTKQSKSHLEHVAIEAQQVEQLLAVELFHVDAINHKNTIWGLKLGSKSRSAIMS